MSEANDGIHRRPDFVTHIGQESTLRLIRHFCHLFGGSKFSRSLLDQFLQVMTVVIQFFTDPLFLGDILLDRKIMRHQTIRLANRRNHDMFIIDFTGFPPVNELPHPRFFFQQCRPERTIGFRWRLTGMEESRIPADRFFN